MNFNFLTWLTKYLLLHFTKTCIEQKSLFAKNWHVSNNQHFFNKKKRILTLIWGKVITPYGQKPAELNLHHPPIDVRNVLFPQKLKIRGGWNCFLWSRVRFEGKHPKIICLIQKHLTIYYNFFLNFQPINKIITKEIKKRYEIQLTTEVTVNISNQIFPNKFILFHFLVYFQSFNFHEFNT